MVSQKMKATASTQGFTLVELIVVITILAILGTIGFISIQGYSAQSRDSKRLSDIRSISSAVTIKSTEGIQMLSFVGDTSSKMTAGTVAGLALSAATDYNAGIPAYTILGISSASFKDGTNEYRIGATSRKNGVFQVAATMENNGGTKTAAVTGNYAARTNTGYALSSNATIPSVANTAFTVNLDATAAPGVIGFFQRGDTINLQNNATNTLGKGTITAVSGDGKSATVTTTLTAGTVTHVSLGDAAIGAVTFANYSEAGGLIGKTAALGTAVTNNNTDLPY